MKTSTLLAAIGGLLAIVAVFLPVMTISMMGMSKSATLLDDPETKVKAYIMIAMGVISILGGFMAKNKRGMGWGVLIAGLVIAGLGLLWMMQVKKSGLDVGYGLYIMIVAGILSLFGGLMAARGK